jgi:hypothetical protein
MRKTAESIFRLRDHLGFKLANLASVVAACVYNFDMGPNRIVGAYIGLLARSCRRSVLTQRLTSLDEIPR